MSAQTEHGDQTTAERAAATLAEILAMVDAGTLEASPNQRAYLLGVLAGLALLEVPDTPA